MGQRLSLHSTQFSSSTASQPSSPPLDLLSCLALLEEEEELYITAIRGRRRPTRSSHSLPRRPYTPLSVCVCLFILYFPFFSLVCLIFDCVSESGVYLPRVCRCCRSFPVSFRTNFELEEKKRLRRERETNVHFFPE